MWSVTILTLEGTQSLSDVTWVFFQVESPPRFATSTTKFKHSFKVRHILLLGFPTRTRQPEFFV